MIVNKFEGIPQGHDQLCAVGTEAEAEALSNCLRGCNVSCVVGTLPNTGPWVSVFVPQRLTGRARIIRDGFNAGAAHATAALRMPSARGRAPTREEAQVIAASTLTVYDEVMGVSVTVDAAHLTVVEAGAPGVLGHTWLLKGATGRSYRATEEQAAKLTAYQAAHASR